MKLIEYRKQHGLSQADLAEKIGVTQGAVHQFEKGLCEPSGRTAMRIVEVTNGEVRMADLYTQTRPDAA